MTAGVLALPGAESVLVPGAGHMVNMEQPTMVSELLRFIDGLPPAPRSG